MSKFNFIKVAKQYFLKITLRHSCSVVNLLHIFRVPFLKKVNTDHFYLSFIYLNGVCNTNIG